MAAKTLNDLLDIAIKVEQGSQSFYKAALEKANDQKTKELLTELYNEEIQHERILLSLKESELYDGSTQLPSGLELNLETSHSLASEEIPSKITYETIVKAALTREAHAIELFSNLSKIEIIPSEFQELFHNLCEEEKRHHEKMEALGFTVGGLENKEM